MSMNRRDLVSLLPAALALGAILPEATGAAAAASDAEVLPSKCYAFADLPVKTSPHVITRHILKGKLATGEEVEAHETTLPPGGAPHPAHRHEHTEMWLIREGTMEITIEGKSQRLGPGSLGFVRSNELHGVTNPTDASTTYFVVAIGPGAAK